MTRGVYSYKYLPLVVQQSERLVVNIGDVITTAVVETARGYSPSRILKDIKLAIAVPSVLGRHDSIDGEGRAHLLPPLCGRR